VERDKAVTEFGQAEIVDDAPVLGAVNAREESVDHDVADEMNLIGPEAFRAQILDSVG
jgi:hypothetical protein